MRILTTFFISVGMIAVVNAANRPNFVWIISEDNSIHYLDHFFAGGADTPHIKSLAAHGITYDHAFSNSPVCSVARSTLITGCYAPRIGTQYHRRSAMAPMPEGVRMFPAYLRAQQGYYTTNRSKTDYNAKPGKGVWDESSNKAHWRKRKPGQPFFHKASYPISHESSLHFNEQSMKSQPTRHDPKNITLAPYHPDTPTFRYTHARYLDNIVKIDGVVGQVVAQLKEDGVLKDTFIFYFGDHGGVLPRSKGYAYESGLHIPLVVRVPENFRHLVSEKPGSRQKGFVGFIDFGPTVLNLAGVKIPGNIDGRPFLGKGAGTREFAFGYADRFDEKYDLVRWIRKGRFSYQRNYQPFNFDSLQNDYRYKQLAFQEWRELFREGKLNAAQRQFFEPRSAEALYDLMEDPHEVSNLAGDPRYADTLVQMRDMLHGQVTDINDLSLFPEPYMVSEAMENPAGFGRLHAARVARLVDIADLQLVEFSKAKEGIESALQSKDPWARYWGCIVASAHGQAPQDLADLIEILALDDPEPLVRCRAAEFLGLTSDVDPRPIIKAALKMSQSEVATNLILNTAVLLQDGNKGIKFDALTREDVNHSGRYVQARLAYLSGRKPPVKVRRKKTKKD
ncbi:MAG: sulfatase [Verrucomicrobiota bacterium]|nr:sulfatase [Verrucomicrobiota bacterium]